MEEIEDSGIVVDDIGIDTEIDTGAVEDVGAWLLMSPSRSMTRLLSYSGVEIRFLTCIQWFAKGLIE